MTLIIRSDKALSAPQRTVAAVPNMGVSDVLAFWAAGSAPGVDGGAVSTVPSSVPAAPALAPTMGTPAVGQTGTTRWLNMHNVADSRLSPSTAINYPSAVTIFMVARWAYAGTGAQRITALAGTTGGFIINGNGTCVLDSGSTVNGVWPPPAANTWHRVIGVINGASSSITTDGVTLTGNAGTNPTSGIPLVRGTNVFGVDFICHGVIGHAATTAELAKIDAALAAMITS